MMAKAGSIGSIELEESRIHDISTEESLEDSILVRILSRIDGNLVPRTIRNELFLSSFRQTQN